MPFTPFHMGPGIVIKALLQGSFSLMVFGWAQIVMDIQPLVALTIGVIEVHGFSHTFIGATLIAVFSALTGKYISEFGLRIMGIDKYQAIDIAWWVAFISAFIGTFSHVFLDSIMHADVQPFFPMTLVNDWHGLMSVSALYQLCIYSGLIGGVVYFAVRKYLSRL